MSESKFRFFTVTYMMNEAECVALEELNRIFREYVCPDGRRPFADQTIEKTFEYVMMIGSRYDIARKISLSLMNMGLMSLEEFDKKSGIPIEEWEKDEKKESAE